MRPNKSTKLKCDKNVIVCTQNGLQLLLQNLSLALSKKLKIHVDIRTLNTNLLHVILNLNTVHVQLL